MKSFPCIVSAHALVLGLVFASSASAQVEITSSSFSGISGSQFSFTPFDPSLGTLNSVNLELTGEIDATVLPTPLITGLGIPSPYPISIGASLDFTALSQSEFGGFSTGFAPPFEFSQASISDGTGTPVVVPIPFFDSITFDSLSDFSGFTFSSDGALEDASLSDFVAGPFSSFLPPTEIVVANVGDFGSALPVAPLYADVNGAMLITYNYTPAPVNTPPSNVPDTSETVSLLGGVFALMAVLRRRFVRYGPHPLPGSRARRPLPLAIEHPFEVNARAFRPY
jgi:hypothetical protein